MLTLLFLFLALIVLALGAWHGDTDNSEWVESTEWERRQRLFWLSLKLSHV